MCTRNPGPSSFGSHHPTVSYPYFHQINQATTFFLFAVLASLIKRHVSFNPTVKGHVSEAEAYAATCVRGNLCGTIERESPYSSQCLNDHSGHGPHRLFLLRDVGTAKQNGGISGIKISDASRGSRHPKRNHPPSNKSDVLSVGPDSDTWATESAVLDGALSRKKSQPPTSLSLSHSPSASCFLSNKIKHGKTWPPKKLRPLCLFCSSNPQTLQIPNKPI